MPILSFRKYAMTMLIIVVSFLFSGNVSAAGIDFHVKDTTVREAMLQLQRQHGFSIIVESDNVDMNRVVTVSLKNAQIKNIIESIFAGQDISYSVNGKRIVVSNGKKKEKKFQSVKLDTTVYHRYFREVEPKEAVSIIEKALEMYFANK